MLCLSVSLGFHCDWRLWGGHVDFAVAGSDWDIRGWNFLQASGSRKGNLNIGLAKTNSRLRVGGGHGGGRKPGSQLGIKVKILEVIVVDR